MSKLTNKQLYGYALMKWEENFKKSDGYITKMLKFCSFCFDSDGGKRECRIDRTLCKTCKSENSSLYKDITNKRREFFTLIESMIDQLREKYYEK